MTIGGSLFLIAVGAILKWAVTAHVSWINIETAGTVIFIVGLIGLCVSLVYTFWWTQRDQSVAAANDPARRMTPPPSQNDPRYQRDPRY
jgi:hypothetical protein